MPSRTLLSQPTPIRLQDEKLRAVIWGEPGVGKTTLAMTFPKPLVIDTDAGLVSVTVKHPDEDLGERWVPNGHEDLESLIFFIKHRIEDAADKGYQYETINIDSGDELVFLLMDELLQRSAAYDASKGKTDHPTMEYVPEQREYYANQRQMHAFLHELRRIGLHTVFTFGVRDKLGEKRAPDVAPGMLKIIQRWASVSAELVVVDEDGGGAKAGDRVLLTAPDGKRQAKTRFASLAPYVINPTFEKLWTPVQAELSGKGAK